MEVLKAVTYVLQQEQNIISKMKKTIFILICLMGQSFIFAKDYKCTFVYKVATSSGIGKCTEGTDPIVKIDYENNKITFPDFVFTDTKTIPEYTVSDVEMNKKSDGVIEIRKDSFELIQAGKKITGKKLYGTVNADELELEVILKVGKMPFNLKVTYFTETMGTDPK